MKIVLEYKDGTIEELDYMPRPGHKLNGNRPIKITTTGVQKFDESGKYLTQEYSLLTNLLHGKSNSISATELDIIYDELLGWYVHCMNDETKYHKFIDAKKNKEEFEALNSNVKTPQWYDDFVNKKNENQKGKIDESN